VIFDQVYKNKFAKLVASGKSEDEAKKCSIILGSPGKWLRSMEANGVEDSRL